jgi:hypothetical protein
VTLLRTVEDYMNLSRRVDRLREFDNGTGVMIKWHALLKPIFDELVQAAGGNHNPEFWSKVCSNIGGGSGPSYISGWATAFCCFDDKGVWRGDRTSIQTWGRTETSVYPIVDTNDIPSGLVTVPVKVDDNGVEYKTRMIAGSFLLRLVDDVTLTPRLDWAIAVEDDVKKSQRQQSPW